MIKKKIEAVVKLNAALVIAETTRNRARRYARRARRSADFAAVKAFNDVAYSGDCMVSEIREMKAALKK